ncbi:type II toxin-antitoxin system ParD family antitoxin [Methylobacterium sp. NMS14P]|uniref:type II toxin-antitoxin system ParD family antitoxin n=1 Tax=Methylobacterium sp. NMS14P TaxID=2894310 RepID=UPI002358ECE2|nr:type II toxin-antitoxin system ParD family antitoxin [Methylobacterium sp. NMS14P]WCS24205.1 type II toxin-antitoxin system ParD family antitoxin [Methylobacterium sp. NMS14P]
MAVRKSVSISLSPELHAVAERMLASGRYGNFSEVVRAALRLLDERERAFQTHNDIHHVGSSAPAGLEG